MNNHVVVDAGKDPAARYTHPLGEVVVSWTACSGYA